MNWANMINHIIFSLAVPIPESAQTRLSREEAAEGTLRRTIQSKLMSFIPREPVMR